MPTITVKQKVDVKYLYVNAGVRYWEDSSVNGIEDVEGTLIPWREGERWKPIINIEKGVIALWKSGTVARVHYKVCDDGIYKLVDANKKVVKEINGYVPEILCPEGGGYGDYIIMNIDADGKIDKWKVNLREFEDD